MFADMCQAQDMQFVVRETLPRAVHKLPASKGSLKYDPLGALGLSRGKSIVHKLHASKGSVKSDPLKAGGLSWGKNHIPASFTWPGSSLFSAATPPAPPRLQCWKGAKEAPGLLSKFIPFGRTRFPSVDPTLLARGTWMEWLAKAVPPHAPAGAGKQKTAREQV